MAQIGFAIGAVGSLIILLNPSSLGIVLGGLVIKSFGLLPTYAVMAQIAEALDHIEWQNGFRADGFSASVYSILITVTAGIAQSVIIGGVSLFGYISPANTAEIINQPVAVQSFFTWCYAGIPMIGFVIGAVLMTFFDVEKMMPQISTEISARRKAEAEARGEVYISLEEKAEQEQERLDKLAEEKRLEELKVKCAKKGLNFEEEEKKYQEKVAAKAVKNNKKK